MGQFEILASLILLPLGWVFVPFYVKSGVFTMPEFLERRFSKGSRTYLTWGSRSSGTCSRRSPSRCSPVASCSRL